MTLVYKNIFPFAILISFVFVQNTCAALNNTADLKERKASVLFQENKGQVHDQNNNSRTDILYSGINGNMSFYLKENGMNYQLMRVDEWKRELKDSLRDTTSIKVPSKYTIQRLDISWVGANPNPQIETLKPTKDFENFYLPSCPDGALGVKSYEEVTYKEIYNGIDLIFHNKYNSLNYDFKVKPGVDYHQIKIEIKGADKINLTKEGDVIISTPLGDIVEGKPIVYQQGKLLESNWVLEDSQLRFNIKNVDSSYELLIDPLVRNWGTYYGGNFNETENNGACTTDKLGNVFIGGGTVSTTNIATSGVFQTALSESATINAYVAKFNNTGNRLWGTYYGGNSTTWLNSLEADNHGNIYACGETFADSGLSSVGAHQLLNTDGFDAFLVKFNINGERIWGTFYGGWGWDHGSGCSIDKNGYIYMAGHTSSNNFEPEAIATTGSHQPLYGEGTGDAFLVKFDSLGNRLWGTYYGGDDSDYATDCSTDTMGNIFILGYSSSTNSISTSGIHQEVKNLSSDIFIAKFNTDGIRLWGTYFGGEKIEQSTNCKTDINGHIYITGSTKSTSNISTPGSFQSALSGNNDGVIAKFSSNGLRMWASYIGGSSNDFVEGCDVNNNGEVIISGTTYSGNFPLVNEYVGPVVPGGIHNAFLAKFENDGVIEFSTDYGGESFASGLDCAFSTSNDIYLFGVTASENGISSFPAHQLNDGNGLGSAFDNFLVQFCDSPPQINNPIVGPEFVCFDSENVIYTIDIEGWVYSHVWSIPSDAVFIYGQGTDSIVINFGDSVGNISIFAVNACGYSDIQTLSVTFNDVKPNVTLSTLTDSICKGDNVLITASGGSSYLWNTGDTTQSILVSPTSDEDFFVTVSENGCDSISPPISIYVKSSFINSDSSYVCEGDSLLIFGSYQSEPGVYYDSLQTIFGCDSILEFKLSKISSTIDTININICDGDSVYLQGGFQFFNGLYLDTLQSVLGCDSIILSQLNVILPKFTNTDTSICFGDSIWLGGYYQTTTGIYYDTLSSVSNCDSILLTNLSIKPRPSKPNKIDTIACFNDGIPLLFINPQSGGEIEWYNNVAFTNLLHSGNTYQPTINTEGNYTFYVKEVLASCYSDPSPIYLQINKPEAEIHPSVNSGYIPLNVLFGNSSINSSSYYWEFGNGDTSNVFEPDYTFIETGEYTIILTAIDTLGCFDKTSVSIFVDEEIIISIPNTITPNGDGANDYWVIENIDKYPNNVVEIFNRNGNSVYKSSDYANDWNGTYKGNDLPATTYYYIIDLKIGSGVLKGDLSIIRE